MNSFRLPKRLVRPLGYPNVAGLPENRQRDLRFFWLDGFVYSLAASFATPYNTLYLLSLGASNAQIGLTNTLSQLFAAFSIPGAMVADRTGRYRQLVVQVNFFNRLLWPLMALAPIILLRPDAVWLVMLCLVGINALGNLTQPAWAALSAEMVPPHMRGGYFASRNIAMQLIQLAAIPLAGQLINGLGEPVGFQANLIICFLISLVSLYYYNQLGEHEVPPAPAADAPPLPKELDLRTQLRSMPNFVYFMIAHATLSMGAQIGAPFIQVYMAEEAHFDAGTIGLVATVGVFSTMMAMRYFGRIHDRIGIKRTMYYGLFVPLIPIAWLGVHAPWQAFLIQLMAGSSWAGYNLGAFNMLLGSTPDAHRPRYIAIHTTVTALVSAIGPIFGGWLLDQAGYLPVFSLSTIVRCLGLILFIALVREPGLLGAAPAAEAA